MNDQDKLIISKIGNPVLISIVFILFFTFNKKKISNTLISPSIATDVMHRMI